MIIEIALRIMGRDSKHTANAIISISLVVAMIISLFGIINGFSSGISSLTSVVSEGNKIMIQEDVGSFEESKIPEQIADLCAIDNVKTIIPQKYLQAKLEIQNGSQPHTALVPFWGMDKILFLSELTGNSANSEYVADPDAVLMGEDLLSQLDQELPLTANITTEEGFFSHQTVVNQSFTRALNYDVSVVGSPALANKLRPELEGYYSIIQISVHDKSFISDTVYSLSKQLENKGDFKIEVIQKRQQFIFETFEEVTTKFQYFALAIYMIVLIKIFHAITWLLLEHEYDFVLLKTLGMSKIQIALMTFLIPIVLGNIALFCGILLGVSFPPIVVGLAVVLLDISPRFFILNIPQLVQVGLILNVIFIIGSIWPIYNISQTDITSFKAMNN